MIAEGAQRRTSAFTALSRGMPASDHPCDPRASAMPKPERVYEKVIGAQVLPDSSRLEPAKAGFVTADPDFNPGAKSERAAIREEQGSGCRPIRPKSKGLR